MIVLSCKDICKSYGIRDILKNITFSINEGDKVVSASLQIKQKIEEESVENE